MIDPIENHGAVMELRRLALQKVRFITEAQAQAYSVSGQSLFEWINYAPEMSDWRARSVTQYERHPLTRLRKWWRSLASPSVTEQEKQK